MTVIRVENLGKKYILRHQQRESYTALRDVMAHGAKRLGAKLLSPFTVHSSRSLRSAPCLPPSALIPSREDFWALKDVSFEVKQGEVVGIIGRNGAGKSTLLKILSRITEPTTGSVKIKGRVASLLEVGTGFHPELTGRENVYLNGAILGMTKAEIKKRFDEIVAFAEIEKFLDTPVKRYSSGMYVRLAFAVAAHLEPEILIVDEVLAVGDAQFQKKCMGKMGEVAKGGRTVLFVSHNMAAIQSLCSRGVLLENGMIVSTAGVKLVVEDYLKSVMTIQDAIPLTARIDRIGGDRLKFTSYRLGNSDSRDNLFLACGCDGRIEIEFHSLETHLDHLRFGILFREKLSGLSLMEFNSYYATKEILSCREGVGRIIFAVKKFPLSAGDYIIDLIATSDLEVLDWVKEAGTVTIQEGNFYSTGRMPISKGIIFHHEYTCYLDRSQL